ncbi:hypothetical protein GCM10009550_64790 [Actinocorallia libanotica]|uniref:Uncharacterized protein n=1 Tax=Actinocorallia libanotica TaxID=46162 RepID=A0ABP4CCA2_9ACTN
MIAVAPRVRPRSAPRPFVFIGLVDMNRSFCRVRITATRTEARRGSSSAPTGPHAAERAPGVSVEETRFRNV